MAELSASGLTDVQVFGIEGPTRSLVKAAEQQPGDGPTDDLIVSAMAEARMAEPYPELLAMRLAPTGRAVLERAVVDAQKQRPGAQCADA